MPLSAEYAASVRKWRLRKMRERYRRFKEELRRVMRRQSPVFGGVRADQWGEYRI